MEEDAQVNDLGPNAVFPYTLHLCFEPVLKEQVYALFCFGSLVRLRMRFSSPTATFGFGLLNRTFTSAHVDVRAWRDGRGCAGDVLRRAGAEHHQFAIGLPN